MNNLALYLITLLGLCLTQPMAQAMSVQWTDYGYDNNGNVTELYDGDSGEIVGQYEYDPYGNTIKAEGQAAWENKIRFSTKEYDSSTGLYYYGFRYYDPVTGRWPSRDPIEELGGINLFNMVSNDAVNRFDIIGLTTYYKDVVVEEDFEWTGTEYITGIDKLDHTKTYKYRFLVWDPIECECWEHQHDFKIGYYVKVNTAILYTLSVTVSAEVKVSAENDKLFTAVSDALAILSIANPEPITGAGLSVAGFIVTKMTPININIVSSSISLSNHSHDSEAKFQDYFHSRGPITNLPTQKVMVSHSQSACSGVVVNELQNANADLQSWQAKDGRIYSNN